MRNSRVIGVVAGMALGLFLAAGARAEGELTQIQQDFSQDPGWESWQNRVIGQSNPTITQNFGWTPTTHASQSPGEIGGKIFMSTTPAWYGLPLGRPLSFRDRFSASGTIAIPQGDSEGAYFGFFNSQRQGWRPWNLRRGGKYVDLYFDDLTYTARPPAGERARHTQTVVTYSYPPKGRKH